VTFVYSRGKNRESCLNKKRKRNLHTQKKIKDGQKMFQAQKNVTWVKEQCSFKKLFKKI
jgi:hypothetical protein